MAIQPCQRIVMRVWYYQGSRAHFVLACEIKICTLQNQTSSQGQAISFQALAIGGPSPARYDTHNITLQPIRNRTGMHQPLSFHLAYDLERHRPKGLAPQANAAAFSVREIKKFLDSKMTLGQDTWVKIGVDLSVSPRVKYRPASQSPQGTHLRRTSSVTCNPTVFFFSRFLEGRKCMMCITLSVRP